MLHLCHDADPPSGLPRTECKTARRPPRRPPRAANALLVVAPRRRSQSADVPEGACTHLRRRTAGMWHAGAQKQINRAVPDARNVTTKTISNSNKMKATLLSSVFDCCLLLPLRAYPAPNAKSHNGNRLFCWCWHVHPIQGASTSWDRSDTTQLRGRRETDLNQFLTAKQL